MRAKEIKGKKKNTFSHLMFLLFLSASMSGTILSSPAQAQDKLKRFHLRVEIGHFWSDKLGGNFKELLRNWKYGYGYVSTGWLGIGEGRSIQYPMGEQGYNFYAFKLDYSLSARWAIRLTVTPSPKWDIEGCRVIILPFGHRRFLNLESRYKGGAYYAGFVYTTDLQEAKYVWNLGAGIGLEVIDLDYELFEDRTLLLYGLKSSQHFAKKGMGSYVFAEFEYFRSRHLSLAGHVSYKYVFPVKFESFQMTAYYENIERNLETFASIFPEHRVNFSGLGIGISLGFHY